MANPRQRRKARSGASKVKQSRRQNDKLKKIVVTGPAVLRKEWNTHLTPRQNLQNLGLSTRPLALRQSGGIELTYPAAQPVTNDDEESSVDSSEEEEEMEEDDEEESILPVATTSTATTASTSTSSATKQKDSTSKDIPRGYARIVRDDKGNVVDVIMSALDEADEQDDTQEDGESDEDGTPAEEEWLGIPALATQEDPEATTPWGKPLADPKEQTRLDKLSKPILAKSAGIRALEAQAQDERKTPASLKRFASPAERESLTKLARKHGEDIEAMARDTKLNRDQRTAGQLRKAFARVGGVESVLSA